MVPFVRLLRNVTVVVAGVNVVLPVYAASCAFQRDERAGLMPGAGGALYPVYDGPQVRGTVRQPGSGSPVTAPPMGRQALHPQSSWTAPPLPGGSFNPSRTIETEEADRGLGQLGEGNATKLSELNANTATSENEVTRDEGIQTAAFQKAQEQLKESYKNLGNRQGEQANAAGVLSGGALLQAAAKRAANEGKENATQQTAFNQQKEGDALQMAKLIQAQGRGGEALAAELRNAGSNNAFFRKAQEQLEGQEAAERGYNAPTEPGAVAARAREQAGGVVPYQQQNKNSFVRVGAPLARAAAVHRRK